MKIKILLFLLLFSTALYAQDLDSLKSTLKPRKFIDKVEIFLGPNLSFNYGNKFIENYEDENVKNTRLLKWGYVAGVGVNHPVTNRIDLNVRLQYETKGTKNKLDVPDINGLGRIIINSEYTYQYFTLAAIPQLSIGKYKRFIVGIGAYFSRIKGIKGFDQQLFDREDMEDTKIHFEGRIFRDLTNEGFIHGTSIRRQLRGMEQNDLGLLHSIEYSIPHHLAFRVVNMVGFQNINKDNSFNLEERNHTWALTIGYTFIRN